MTNIDELKSTGLKATLPRLKILEVFQRGTQRHMTAEDVYKALLVEGADIGLATVYRVLMQFEQAGMLSRNHFESGKAVFELNEGKHHDHLVCLDCGRVEEFYDAEIERAAAADRQGSRLRAAGPLAVVVCALHDEPPERPASAVSQPGGSRARPRRSRGASAVEPQPRLLHGALVALDEFLVGVDAAQLQDRVAHRRFDQHGQVAAGVHRDHRLADRHVQDVLRRAARRAAARIRAPSSPCAPGAR